MDQIDRRLLRALERNPRLTCRQLSDLLGISVTAVQNRISALERTGCILSYNAWVSLEALGGVRAIVLGQMKIALNEGMLKALEENGSVIIAVTGSQNYLYLWTNLCNISDLDDVLRTAQDKCNVAAPEALIIGSGSAINISSTPDRKDRPPIDSLKDIDHRIICSLHDDARKPISKLAEELGASAKTVRKHLDRLVEDDLIEFFVDQDPRQQGELFFYLFIRTSSISSRDQIKERLRRDRSSFVGHVLAFSNQPHLLVVEMITRSVAELREKMAEVQACEGVVSIAWDLCLQRFHLKTWRDRLIDEKLRELNNKKKVPGQASALRSNVGRNAALEMDASS